MQSLVASIPDSSTGEDVAAKQRTTAGTVNCQGGTISIYKLNCRLLKHIYKKHTHTHTVPAVYCSRLFISSICGHFTPQTCMKQPLEHKATSN
jgi:hypothetical protein